jgi:hypothetical protein
MTNEEWINGKVEETDTQYRVSGRTFLWKDEIQILKKGVELLCQKFNPKSILEFGFGMGWTASEFQKQGVEKHTILEPNKELYQKALEWKSKHDDSEIEILNIFSWDYETDKIFDLVYDDRQAFQNSVDGENELHFSQMDKILPNGQTYAQLAYCSGCKVSRNDKGYTIVKKFDDKYIIQHASKWKKGMRAF